MARATLDIQCASAPSPLPFPLTSLQDSRRPPDASRRSPTRRVTVVSTLLHHQHFPHLLRFTLPPHSWQQQHQHKQGQDIRHPALLLSHHQRDMLRNGNPNQRRLSHLTNYDPHQHHRPDSPSSFRSSTSSLASSSNRSLTSIFSSLTPDDVRFFDHLIATLSPGDASFASLNTAYQSLRRKWPGIRDSNRDDHLYSSLLSLVKVRGRDWSERWDAVRVGLGLQMRNTAGEEDVTDSTATPTLDEDSPTEIHTLGGSSSSSSTATTLTTATTLQRHSSQWSRNPIPTDQDADSQWTQDTSQSEGSDADQSSQSTEEEKRHPKGKAVDRRHGATTTSPQIAALQAKRDALIRQASMLARQAAQSASPHPPASPRQRTSDSSTKVEQLTRLLSRLQHQDPDTETSTSDSRSQSPTSSPAASPVRPTPRPPASQTPRTTPNAQRRIDEMLASLRADRESLRDTVQRHAQESEEAAWSGTMRLADRHHSHHLLSKSWTWWRHVDQTRLAAEDKAVLFHNHSLLSSNWHSWHHNAQKSRSLTQTSLRANHLRGLLYGWRIWTRRYNRAKQAHWESRKDEMRHGYSQVKQKRTRDLLSTALTSWRRSLRTRRAETFRNGHLLGGAFYLWRIKLDVSHELSEQYVKLLDIVQHRQKQSSLRTWRTMTKLQPRIDQWHDSHRASGLRSAWQMWHRKATLTPLATTYATQRLQRSTLRTWLQRLSEADVRKRRQSQADRLRCRNTQRQALKQWIRARDNKSTLQARAEEYRRKSDRRVVKHTLIHWKLHSRATLLIRVKQGRLQKAMLDKWRNNLKDKTVTLPKRARKLARRSETRVAAVCMRAWITRVRGYITNAHTAQQIADQTLLKDIVGQWKSARQRHVARAEEADAFNDVSLLRGGWTTMRSRIEARRLRELSAKKSSRLMERTLHRWRARATQQALDRLSVAHMQAKRTTNLQRQTLGHWMQRVIERRSVLIEVTEAHKDKVLKGALQHWRRSLVRVRDLHRLGESFTDIGEERFKRKHLHHWHKRYRTMRSLRERVDRFTLQRRDSLQRRVFQAWYNSWRESLLHEQEYTTSVRRQTSIQSRTLRIWIGKTTHIPALRFHHTKLKFLALQRWKESLPHALLRRQGIAYDEETLTRKALSHWIEKAKNKRAARAAARFGGPSLTRMRRQSARLGSPFVVVRRRVSGGGGAASVATPTREGDVGGDGGGDGDVDAPPLPLPALPSSSRRPHTRDQPRRPSSVIYTSTPHRDINRDGGDTATPTPTARARRPRSSLGIVPVRRGHAATQSGESDSDGHSTHAESSWSPPEGAAAGAGDHTPRPRRGGDGEGASGPNPNSNFLEELKSRRRRLAALAPGR